MICFSTSHTDGTEDSHHVSLRALMAAKQTPVCSPSILARKIIERRLGLHTRKTLEARTNLLDTACHSLAKAKQRTLVSVSPSYYLRSDPTLFPLPLPPGYKPSNTRNTPKSSSLSKSGPLSKSTSNSSKTKRIDVHRTNPTSNFPATNTIHVHTPSSSSSSNSPPSPFHSHSHSITTCSSSSEALTPSSSTSSSVFSAAPSSLSQSSSFSSSSTNSCNLRCRSLAHALENESRFLTPLPPPPPNHQIHAVTSSLKEFSPIEIARACENFDDTHKLRDGSMGPLYRAFLPTEQLSVAIARVATELSRRKWRAQMQVLGRLEHPNLCRVIGFSYERAGRGGGEGVREVINRGYIVYESMGNESLEEFVEDLEKGHSHIDWSTRLNIAIGVAEGLSFLLQSHVSYGDLSMSNILIDLSANAKLFDFVLSSSLNLKKENNSSNVVKALGNLLLKLFDFMNYAQDVETQGLRERHPMEKVYPSRDARLVIQLAASCLLTEESLRPSIQHVACVLRSIEPTQHVAKFSNKRSKSFTYRKKKSLSFG